MNRLTRVRRLASVGGRFLIVGGLSTLIEVGVFNLLVYVFGWDLVSAKITASLVALVNAYIGNREWAFRHRDRRGRMSELFWFLLTNAVCTALGAALVWVGVEALRGILGHTPGAFAVNIVNLLSIGIIVLVRFAMYHWVVFRVSPKPASQADAADQPAS